MREFGDPEEVARRYDEPRSLIGPRLYPAFESIAVAAIVAPAAIAIAVHGVRWLASGGGFNFAAFANGVWNYIQNTFVFLGLTVLVFAVLERVTAHAAASEGAGKAWDPRALPPVPAEAGGQPFKIRDAESRIWGNVLLLVLVNIFPQWFGIPWGWHYRYVVIPFAELGARMHGRGIALAVMLSRPASPTIDAAWFARHGWPAGAAVDQELSTVYGMSRVLRATLWVCLVRQLWQTVVRLWGLYARRQSTTSPVM